MATSTSTRFVPPPNPEFQTPHCPLRDHIHQLQHVAVRYAKGHRMDGSTPDLEAHVWSCPDADAQWFVAGDRPAKPTNRLTHKI